MDFIPRKSFLRVLLKFAGIFTVATLSAGAQEKLELRPGEKQLFLDDHVIKEVHNLRQVIHRPKKISPDAIIRPEHPWENLVVQTRNAPFWDPAEQVWKLYYISFLEDEGGTANSSAQCLAISMDGLQWTKPNLGLVEWEGSKANNIVTLHRKNRQAMSELYHVIYDPNDVPARRYKGFFGINGRQPAVSPDGLHWQMLNTPVIPSQDESQLIYDELGGQFLATVKHEGPYGRSAYLVTSKDFNEWTKPRMIFHADGEDQTASRRRIAARLTDPRFAPLTVNRPADYNTDVYNLPVFPYEGIYIGTPMFFNQSGPNPAPIGNTDGFHHVELVMSRDLIRWERVAGRALFMENAHAGTGAYDTAQYIPANRPVRRGNELWFYHSGIKYRFHPDNVRTRPDGTKTYMSLRDSGAIYVSRLRLDGFVSLVAGELEGALLTRPLLVKGKRLHVNANVRSGGRLRAEVLDAAGRTVMEGFTADNSAVLADDQLGAQLSWAGGKNLGDLAGKQVRLRFVFQQADLYGFWVTD
ncbi:MAG: hypothetical protein HY736_08295 [Verrucomicrobia bacterium]|nr:hypothetical protein [Verrucomicrobiota bacterium]